MAGKLATTVNLSPPLVLTHGLNLKKKSREKMRNIIAQSNE